VVFSSANDEQSVLFMLSALFEFRPGSSLATHAYSTSAMKKTSNGSVLNSRYGPFF
jgi:hypothetical protein